VAIEARVHRLSTAEYARMVDSGALDGLRIELLDGLLVDVSPQGDPDRHPSTALLVVEVAVTSQAEDRRKAPVYARADIPRYWLVDLRDRVVIEHTVPRPDGYGAVAERSGDDILDANVPGIKPTTVAKLLALATK
jgi:hypothetical protein